jgi:hypothetical protein
MLAPFFFASSNTLLGVFMQSLSSFKVDLQYKYPRQPDGAGK